VGNDRERERGLVGFAEDIQKSVKLRFMWDDKIEATS